jgi:hypothetical protein
MVFSAWLLVLTSVSPSLSFISLLIMSILDRIPVQPVLAVFIGAGLGAGLCVIGQKQMNNWQRQECLSQPDTHRLVTYKSWSGDAKYCIHIRYLAN